MKVERGGSGALSNPIAAGLVTTLAGLILAQPKSGVIEDYPTVGLIAALASLSTLWLAGRLRSGSPAQEVAEPVGVVEFA